MQVLESDGKVKVDTKADGIEALDALVNRNYNTALARASESGPIRTVLGIPGKPGTGIGEAAFGQRPRGSSSALTPSGRVSHGS